MLREMARARFLVVKTGSTVDTNRHRGDFEDWIAAGLGERVDVVRVDQAEAPPDPHAYAGIVVTGSPASVTERAPWMIATGRWMTLAVEADVPLFGICFGHQLLADALGGRVEHNPRGREIGTRSVRLLEPARTDVLFCGLAEDGHMLAQTSHSDTVAVLPAGAVCLADNDLDGCHAFRARADRRAWGVQFHPEFDAAITRGYIVARREAMESEGLSPDEHLARLAETPESASLLARFAVLATAK